MKRLDITSIAVVAVLALGGFATSSASASWECLATFFGQYKADAPIGQQCKEYGIFPIYSHDLFLTGGKEVETGVLCALVEAEEDSFYDGPNCGASEAHEGKGEYSEAIVQGGVNILPLGTSSAPITSHSESGESIFGTKGLTEVNSKTSLGTAESTGELGNSGGFSETFYTVKQPLLGTCTGVGAQSGTVPVRGTYKDVDAALAGKLIAAVLFLLTQVEFSCGSTAVAVAGCVAGEVTPLEKLTTSLTVTLAIAGSPADNVITSYLTSSGLQEPCELLAKVGAGSTELSAQETTQTLSEFKQSGKAIEVLAMGL